MKPYDEIWGVAEDNFGIITSAQANAMGIARGQLVMMERRGTLTHIGHGVYQVKHHVPGPFDPYALGVAMAGEGGFLRGASVLGLLGLATTDLTRFYLGSTRRVRRRLPNTWKLCDRQATKPTEYHGIKSESVAQALVSTLDDGALDVDRVEEAAEEAHRQGYLTDGELSTFRERRMS